MRRRKQPKKAFDQEALTRLKTRGGAGAHRDRRRKRERRHGKHEEWEDLWA